MGGSHGNVSAHPSPRVHLLVDSIKATGWQKHTVRGFISILGSKGGMKISSTRRESDGARVYEA